jgi:hypothetical protein
MLKKPEQNKTMKKPMCLYVFLCCLIFSFPACNSDNDDYKEVSKLISSRNSARYKKAQNQKERKQKKPEPKKAEIKDEGDSKSKKLADNQNTEKKKFSTEIFYEEEIKIVSSFSDETLGVGTAYLNKDGKIVQIKIKRD